MLPVEQLIATLESVPGTLSALLGPIDDATLRTRPEPGEWCPLEVIGHLIACDSDAFRNRIASIASGEPTIASFSAWDAINARDFATESLHDLIDELAAERHESAKLIRSLPPEDWSRAATFHDGREFQASDFLHEWPYHDQDHLQQILAALKPPYLAHMTPVMRAALLE